MDDIAAKVAEVGTKLEALVKEREELLKEADALETQARACRARAAECKKAASELHTTLRSAQIQSAVVAAQQEAFNARAEANKHLEEVKAMKAQLAVEIERAKSVQPGGAAGGGSDYGPDDGSAPTSGAEGEGSSEPG